MLSELGGLFGYCVVYMLCKLPLSVLPTMQAFPQRWRGGSVFKQGYLMRWATHNQKSENPTV